VFECVCGIYVAWLPARQKANMVGARLLTLLAGYTLFQAMSVRSRSTISKGN